MLHITLAADWTSPADPPLCVCTLTATLSIVLRSKTDSGKSRWECPGENEGNLCLHADLGMVAGDGA